MAGNAQGKNDTFPSSGYYQVKHVLQHTYMDSLPIQADIYPNIYFLYNEEEFPQLSSKINSLHLKEIMDFGSLFSGHLYYIPPDSVKNVQRKAGILGNFFTYPGGGAVLDRDITLYFREGTGKSTIDAFLDRNGLKRFDEYSGDLYSYRYVNVTDMVKAWDHLERERIVKEWRCITWTEKGLSEKHVWPVHPKIYGAVGARKKIHNDTLLFLDVGTEPYLDLYIYRVRETDSTFADTLFLLHHTLSYYSRSEDEYVTEAVYYQVQGDKIVFYDNMYSWNELFGAPYQNPRLYSTLKETYVYRSSGALVLLKTEYGMSGSRMLNKELDTEIRKYTQEKFDGLHE